MNCHAILDKDEERTNEILSSVSVTLHTSGILVFTTSLELLAVMPFPIPLWLLVVIFLAKSLSLSLSLSLYFTLGCY